MQKHILQLATHIIHGAGNTTDKGAEELDIRGEGERMHHQESLRCALPVQYPPLCRRDRPG